MANKVRANKYPKGLAAPHCFLSCIRATDPVAHLVMLVHRENAFIYSSLPARVVFGHAAPLAVPAEVERLELQRALVVHAPGSRAATTVGPIVGSISGRLASTFDQAKEHVPADIFAACVATFEGSSCDAVIAVGGGSVIGLGKLVAAHFKAPLVAVPTTYSGAEFTPFNAITEHGVKRQVRDRAMLPAVIVYDPDLTLALPLAITGPSMMNAIAHAVEAFYAPETNPIVALKAAEAIRLAAGALPKVAARLDDRDARIDLLLSAILSGEVLAVTSVGLHHKLCHVLGGRHGLAHAASNAVILPYAVAYNAPGAAHAIAQVAAALGVRTADAPGALFDLAQASGAPASLAALGLAQQDIESVARATAAQSFPNPVSVDAASLSAMLKEAWHGRRP